MPAETAAAYAAPGYLLLVSQGVLAAYPFDAARATVTGEPMPVAQAVGTNDGHVSQRLLGVGDRASWPIARALAPGGSSSGSTAPARCWAVSARRTRMRSALLSSRRTVSGSR